MRNFLMTLLLFAAVCMLASCTSEEAIEVAPDAISLDGSNWTLTGCDGNPYLYINGYGECDYLAYLSFRNGKVFIRHAGADQEVLHHICSMSGNELSISLMPCTSNSWRSMFEWQLLLLDKESLVIQMEAPNIIPDYRTELAFQRAQK